MKNKTEDISPSDELWEIGLTALRAYDCCESNLILKDSWVQDTFREIAKRANRLDMQLIIQGALKEP